MNWELLEEEDDVVMDRCPVIEGWIYRSRIKRSHWDRVLQCENVEYISVSITFVPEVNNAKS